MVMEWNLGESVKERRIRYAGVFLLMLFAEVFIALFINDRIIRPYVGDILVVILVYFAVRVVIPTGCRLLAGICVCIRSAGGGASVFFILRRSWAWQDVPVIGTVLGSTFDWKDIVCYALGCLGLGVYQWARRYMRRMGFKG